MSKQQKSRRRKSKQKTSVGRKTAPLTQTEYSAGHSKELSPPPQQQRRRSLGAFVGLTLLWLAPAFALWYLAGAVLLIPVAWVADLIFPMLFPHAIEAVELQSRVFDIVTQFDYTPPGIAIPEGQAAQYVFSLNGLKYGYGLPLLLALILASPSQIQQKLKYFCLGFVVIVFVQVWGICFESLISLLFKSNQEIAMQMGSSVLSRELYALGYQLGYLILPAVAPLIFWGLTHYSFLQTLLAGPKPQSS